MEPSAPDPATARTETPDAAELPGEASESPFFFTLVLWLGAFFVITWGFRVLLSRLSRSEPPSAPDHGTSPAAEDVTLEEPGPDRS